MALDQGLKSRPTPDMNTELSPVIVALDYADADQALALAGRLDASLCRVKVGKELFTSAGPAVVESLQALGFEVFLDLKFHDIPNTVASAVRAATRLGVWMVNVHASGGSMMMESAVSARDEAGGKGHTLVTAVTVLTSMDNEQLRNTGVDVTAEQQVLRLATLAQRSGVDGIVCSALEASALREQCGPGFCLVTPGIRPADSAKDDQRRIMTPAQALSAGSDFLVIGRPITAASEPLDALNRILSDISYRRP